MKNIIIEFFKAGIYKTANLIIFVEAGYITSDEYKELTGQEYQPT